MKRRVFNILPLYYAYLIWTVYGPMCSPSDLDADLEDNQDYDSTVSQSETNLTTIGQCSSQPSTAGKFRLRASPDVIKPIPIGVYWWASVSSMDVGYAM